MSESDLESLYREAQSALKSRDYVRANELLKQILVIDENYKDVSRLLAQMVKLRRRRWYNDSRVWGVIGFAAIVVLGFFIAPRIREFYAVQPSITVTTTTSPTVMLPPTIVITPTEKLLPTPTPIPLTWKRISIGQEFERDAVTAFATDKKDPDVIYAGMKNAGVYKTIDGGLSWRPAHQGLASTQVESLLIDSQNPRILYAGTLAGIFKTEDGGENWFKIGEGTYLLMDMQNNSHLYARDKNGIYETKDQGNNWTTMYTLKKDCPDAISSWAIHPADGNMLFIGGGETCAGVYQSSDRGHSWALIGLEDKPNINALAIGLDEDGDFSIYADTLDPLVVDIGIYISHDGGVSWTHQREPRCNNFNVDPRNPSIIYCGDLLSLWIRHGKDDTWHGISGTESTAFTAVHIDHPNGTDRIITGGRTLSSNQLRERPGVGVFISADVGVPWFERENGLGSARAELKIDPMDNAGMYLATYYAGAWATNGCALYRSLDSGKKWSSIKVDAIWCGPIFDAAQVLHMIERGSLQKSWDGGENWLWGYERVGEYDQQKADAENAKAVVNRLPVDAQSVSANPYIDNLIYAVGNTIFFSTGSGWQLSTGSEGSWDARLFYTDQSKMIYAIGRYHQSYSTDNGKTWQSCREDVTTSQSDSRLALDLGGSRLYLATPGQGVLVSTDKCQSWQASNEGLNNLFVNTLAINPNNSNKIYAGTDGGAYISFDGGESWGQVNDGLLGATVVYSIAVDKDSNVYAATPYGVFKLEGK